jgi:hypothetical protein
MATFGTSRRLFRGANRWRLPFTRKEERRHGRAEQRIQKTADGKRGKRQIPRYETTIGQSDVCEALQLHSRCEAFVEGHVSWWMNVEPVSVDKANANGGRQKGVLGRSVFRTQRNASITMNPSSRRFPQGSCGKSYGSFRERLESCT